MNKHMHLHVVREARSQTTKRKILRVRGVHTKSLNLFSAIVSGDKQFV